MACCFGIELYVETLLKRGANISTQDNRGDTPLFHAIYASNPNIVDLLITHIISNNPLAYQEIMNHQNKDGLTPVMEAVRLGKIVHLEKLLTSERQYLKVTRKTSEKTLEEASSSSYEENIAEASRPLPVININASDLWGNTALTFAEDLPPNKCEQVQTLLLKNREDKDFDFYKLQRLRLLIEYQRNIYTRDNEGNTLGMRMVSYPPPSSYPQTFLQTSLWIKNKRKQNICELAEGRWSDEWIKNFIIPSAQEQYNQEILKLYDVPLNKVGDTALLIAARHNFQDIVRVLISCGSDVNAQNNRMQTPLMLLTSWFDTFKNSYSRDLRIFTFLFLHGADVNVETMEEEPRTVKNFYQYNAHLSALLDENILKQSLPTQSDYWKAYCNKILELKAVSSLLERNQRQEENINELILWDAVQPKSIAKSLRIATEKHNDFASYLRAFLWGNHFHFLSRNFFFLSIGQQKIFFLMFEKIKSSILTSYAR